MSLPIRFIPFVFYDKILWTCIFSIVSSNTIKSTVKFKLLFLNDFAGLEKKELLNIFLYITFSLFWYLTLFVKHLYGAEQIQQVPWPFYF